MKKKKDQATNKTLAGPTSLGSNTCSIQLPSENNCFHKAEDVGDRVGHWSKGSPTPNFRLRC